MRDLLLQKGRRSPAKSFQHLLSRGSGNWDTSHGMEVQDFFATSPQDQLFPIVRVLLLVDLLHESGKRGDRSVYPPSSF